MEIPLASPAFSIPSTTTNNTIPTKINNTKPAGAKSKSKPRKRVNTAEKRHQHNAVERQRRETLNGKFIVLARLLPALASHRRPSKSAIVNGSITHLTYQREQRLLAATLLRQVSAEHEELLKEVNEWRKANGFQPKVSAKTWTEGMEEVCDVEKEVFGTFANVDGEDEDGDENENENDAMFDSSTFPAVPAFMPQSNGLITPRPSTEFEPAHSMLNVFPTEARSAAPSNGTFNWSTDFAWSMNNGQPPLATPAYPLASFMDPADNANTDSPATSQQGMVVTPPTYTEMMQPSSSPGSANSIAGSYEDVKPVMNVHNAMATWTPAQILFAHQQLQLQRQQQQQQQQLQQQQQQQAAAAFASTFAANPSPTVDPDMDMFTSQLMSSMFTANTVNPPPSQIEHWRRNALGSVPARPMAHQQTSVHDLRNAVRLGMGAAGVPGWMEQTCDGF